MLLARLDGIDIDSFLLPTSDFRFWLLPMILQHTLVSVFTILQYNKLCTHADSFLVQSVCICVQGTHYSDVMRFFPMYLNCSMQILYKDIRKIVIQQCRHTKPECKYKEQDSTALVVHDVTLTVGLQRNR